MKLHQSRHTKRIETMIYRLIAFMSGLANVVSDAHRLRTSLMRQYGWMPE